MKGLLTHHLMGWCSAVVDDVAKQQIQESKDQLVLLDNLVNETKRHSDGVDLIFFNIKPDSYNHYLEIRCVRNPFYSCIEDITLLWIFSHNCWKYVKIVPYCRISII